MRKLLIGLGALVALIIAAFIAATFLIPVQALTDRLAVAVKSATGRDLKIAGPVKLVVLPQPEIEASGVSLANVPGAQDPDMLRLARLEVTLRLLPLLVGHVEVGRFVLTAPQIALEIDKSGRPNWVFTPPQPTPAAAAPAAPASGAGLLARLGLEDVRLSDGTVSYRDDRTGLSETVSAIDFRLSQPDLAHPLNASGAAVWHGQKVTVALAAAQPGSLLAGGSSAVQVKLAAAPLNVAFAGSLTGLPPAGLNGTIDLSVPSVRDLAAWAGTALPPGRGLGHLALTGKIDRGGARTAFSDATITLDAITGKGALTVTTGGKRPLLSGQLALDTLDVNPYLQPEAAAPGGGNGGATPSSAATPQQGWSDTPFDLSPLGLVDADFALTANAIRYRKIAIGPSALALHLHDSRLEADVSRITLYQGQGQAKLGIDGSGSAPTMTVDLSADGVSVGPLLDATSGLDDIEGTGKLDLALKGSGTSQRALVAALGGSGALNLANGEIKGVNLVALASGGRMGSGETTKFGTLTGTFTVANGIAHNNDLKLTSGLVPINGAGTIDLPRQRLDYRVNVVIAGGVGIPVLVSGPWNDLSYRPDLAGVLQGAVKAPSKLLQQLPGTGLLRNLFGK